MDFIEDFVRPGGESGPRLDLESTRHVTIVTDRITPKTSTY